MMQGRVINNISNLYYVEAEGKTYECNARGKLKESDNSLVVGDIVTIKVLEDNKGVIEEIAPRIIYIKRPKIANVDQIILTISLKNPKPDLLMLDKQLCFAQMLDIEAIIVLNKTDLKDDKEIEDIYKKMGYKVIKTSAIKKEGIKEIKTALKNKVSVFAGNSGVGKSSIINELLEEQTAEAGEISQKNKKGKNTTTSVSLYEIEDNTYIADTPGFSTFDIYEIESINLCKYFVEFEKFIPE